MKKLLGISLIAVLTASSAFAATGDVVGTGTTPGSVAVANAVKASGEAPFAMATETANDGKISTLGVVKGAYNAAIKAVNTVQANVAAESERAQNAEQTLDNRLGSAEAILDELDTNYGSDVMIGIARTEAANGTFNEQGSYDSGTIGAQLQALNSSLETLDGDAVKDVTLNGTSLKDANGDVALTVASGSTDGTIRINGADYAVTNGVTTAGTQTLTNKTIDADTNTISNLEVDNLKTGVLSTAVSSTSTNAELATAKAVYDAVDDEAQARAAAITAEETARAAAVTAEETRATNAEAALGTRITNITSDYAKKTGVSSTIVGATYSTTGTVDVITDWATEGASTAAITATTRATSAPYSEPQPAVISD